MSGIGSSGASTSSRLKERPVFFIGIGPRGLSSPFLPPFFAAPPRDGLASGPKLRLRPGAPPGIDEPPPSNGREPPKPPGRGPLKPPGRGALKPPPPGRGGPDE